MSREVYFPPAPGGGFPAPVSSSLVPAAPLLGAGGGNDYVQPAAAEQVITRGSGDNTPWWDRGTSGNSKSPTGPGGPVAEERMIGKGARGKRAAKAKAAGTKRKALPPKKGSGGKGGPETTIDPFPASMFPVEPVADHPANKPGVVGEGDKASSAQHRAVGKASADALHRAPFPPPTHQGGWVEEMVHGVENHLHSGWREEQHQSPADERDELVEPKAEPKPDLPVQVGQDREAQADERRQRANETAQQLTHQLEVERCEAQTQTDTRFSGPKRDQAFEVLRERRAEHEQKRERQEQHERRSDASEQDKLQRRAEQRARGPATRPSPATPAVYQGNQRISAAKPWDPTPPADPWARASGPSWSPLPLQEARPMLELEKRLERLERKAPVVLRFGVRRFRK